MGKLTELYVAVKEIDYIESQIDELCEKYNHCCRVDYVQQRAWLRNYCYDTIKLFDDCFDTTMLGMRRCKAKIATYQKQDDIVINNATLDIFNMLFELKQLVRTMVPIKDLPSCKNLTQLTAEDIMAKAKNLVKSDVVKAGIAVLLLGSKVKDSVEIVDIRSYYCDRLTQLNDEINTKGEIPSPIEQFLLDKFNAELGYCNLAMFKAGIGITEELKGLIEIGKKHIEKFENLQKGNNVAIRGSVIAVHG